MERNLPKFLTLKEASKETGIPLKTLQGWSRNDGSFPAVKIRGRVFVKKLDFIRWLKINSMNNF